MGKRLYICRIMKVKQKQIMNTNYLDPFVERSLMGRVEASFKFLKQNKTTILKWHALFFIPLSLLPASLAQLIPLAATIYSYIIFHIYIRKQSLQNISLGELKTGFIEIFKRYFMFGLMSLVFIIPAIVLLIFCIVFAKVFANSLIVIVATFVIVALFFILISSIAEKHYVFKYCDDVFKAYKETWQMLKGKWFNTIWYMIIISFISIIYIILIILLVFDDNLFANFASNYIASLMHIQYQIMIIYHYGWLVNKLAQTKQINN